MKPRLGQQPLEPELRLRESMGAVAALKEVGVEVPALEVEGEIVQ